MTMSVPINITSCLTKRTWCYTPRVTLWSKPDAEYTAHKSVRHSRSYGIFLPTPTIQINSFAIFAFRTKCHFFSKISFRNALAYALRSQLSKVRAWQPLRCSLFRGEPAALSSLPDKPQMHCPKMAKTRPSL